MKMVPDREAIGATVIAVDTWGGVTVQTEDGRILEIVPEEGHSGPELNVYEGRR